jgi:hypothetical protein
MHRFVPELTQELVPSNLSYALANAGVLRDARPTSTCGTLITYGKVYFASPRQTRALALAARRDIAPEC